MIWNWLQLVLHICEFCIHGCNPIQIKSIWEKTSKKQNFYLLYNSNYLCNIYLALGIISNLEMTKYERMCIDYIQILYHFIQGAWAPWILVSLQDSGINPGGYWKTIVLPKKIKRVYLVSSFYSAGICFFCFLFFPLKLIEPSEA